MADPIEAFWAWWNTAATRIVEGMEARDLGGLDEEITAHVQAIDEGLKWKLGPFHPATVKAPEKVRGTAAFVMAPKRLAPWAEKAGREIEVEMAPDPTWEGLDRWS